MASPARPTSPPISTTCEHEPVDTADEAFPVKAADSALADASPTMTSDKPEEVETQGADDTDTEASTVILGQVREDAPHLGRAGVQELPENEGPERCRVGLAEQTADRQHGRVRARAGYHVAGVSREQMKVGKKAQQRDKIGALPNPDELATIAGHSTARLPRLAADLLAFTSSHLSTPTPRRSARVSTTTAAVFTRASKRRRTTPARGQEDVGGMEARNASETEGEFEIVEDLLKWVDEVEDAREGRSM